MENSSLRVIKKQLNSSPIDELREGAYEGEMRAWSRACRYPPQPRERQPPPGSVTLRHSVEILTNLYTYHGQPRGREGKGENAAQMHNLVLEMHELPEQVHVI